MEEENKTNPTEEGQTSSETPNPTETNPPTPPVEGQTESQPQPAIDEAAKAEKQKKEDDAKFAKMRHERDMAKAKAAGDAEGYKRARLKSIGGKNPYTETPIETDEDYDFYELLDEVNSKGLDPKNPMDVEKVRREIAQAKAKEIEANKSQEQKNQEKADAEVKEYIESGHTQKELQSYWADAKFQEFASDLLGVVPLKTIISKFDKAYPKENPTTRQQAANKAASPGSSKNDEQEVPKKAVKDMTREEFAKYMDDVSKGKVKIN